MKPTDSTISRRATAGLVAALLLVMTVPSFAQQSGDSDGKQRSPRVVLISLTDRQLAVLEDGNVLAYFPVAVGAEESPSPTGEFQIVSRVVNPGLQALLEVCELGESRTSGRAPGATTPLQRGGRASGRRRVPRRVRR